MKPEEIQILKNRLESIRQDLENDKKLVESIIETNKTRGVLIEQIESRLNQHDELINALENIEP